MIIVSWLQELLDIGMGRVAIKTLALIEVNAHAPKHPNCPVCGTVIRKWAVSCPKCRTRIE